MFNLNKQYVLGVCNLKLPYGTIQLTLYIYILCDICSPFIYLSTKQGNTYLFLAQLSCKKKISRFLHQNLNKATGVDQTKRRIKRPTLTFCCDFDFTISFYLIFKKLNVQACYINTQIKDSVFTFKIDI